MVTFTRVPGASGARAVGESALPCPDGLGACALLVREAGMLERGTCTRFSSSLDRSRSPSEAVPVRRPRTRWRPSRSRCDSDTAVSQPQLIIGVRIGRAPRPVGRQEPHQVVADRAITRSFAACCMRAHSSPDRRTRPASGAARVTGSDTTDPQWAAVRSEPSACCVRRFASSATIPSPRPRKKRTSRSPRCGRCSCAIQHST